MFFFRFLYCFCSRKDIDLSLLCPCFTPLIRIIFKRRVTTRYAVEKGAAFYEARWYGMRRYGGIIFLLLVLSIMTVGCQLTQSAFVKTAGDAGSAFAAASTTLTYFHEGKISKAYAASSFVNYASELGGLDQTLPSLAGAPDSRTIQHLLNLYKPAMQVIDAPCLDASCDWRAQVAALDSASKAFLEVSNS